MVYRCTLRYRSNTQYPTSTSIRQYFVMTSHRRRSVVTSAMVGWRTQKYFLKYYYIKIILINSHEGWAGCLQFNWNSSSFNQYSHTLKVARDNQLLYIDVYSSTEPAYVYTIPEVDVLSTSMRRDDVASIRVVYSGSWSSFHLQRLLHSPWIW